ncbi:hypothetical protein QEZ54_09915 [Catellatospora sp. KI3]|uniref:hypothetical protein n=1 Tax=Catellatospora sp. KI3 TaxID=3041620 RepID=UPI0024827787|nr:hypothetical protein [Catellatospora sp. KI3]MDI1461283.1 hypothetical protein [Catellatospora sp. KI3]
MGITSSPAMGPILPGSRPSIVHRQSIRRSARTAARRTTDNGSPWTSRPSSLVPAPEHYALLVSEEEFDAAFERIEEFHVTYSPTRTAGRRAKSTTTTAGAASA